MLRASQGPIDVPEEHLMSRIRIPGHARLGALALASALLVACAQQAVAPAAPANSSSSAAVAASPAAAPAPASIVDPGVLAEMDRMAAALRALGNFELRVQSLTDEMLDASQTAQVGLDAQLKVRRPSGLRVDLRDDRGDRKSLYYNGKSVTVFGPQTGYYATVPAPDTVRGLIDALGERYGIDLPGADLFYWDSSSFTAGQFKSAVYLGEATVDGTPTHHFAFSQDGLDWQVWLQQGDKPLPRKLLLITTSLAARPQHAVLLRWNLAPRIAAGDFEFKPPPGARRIAIQRADGSLEATP